MARRSRNRTGDQAHDRRRANLPPEYVAFAWLVGPLAPCARVDVPRTAAVVIFELEILRDSQRLARRALAAFDAEFDLHRPNRLRVPAAPPLSDVALWSGVGNDPLNPAKFAGRSAAPLPGAQAVQ